MMPDVVEAQGSPFRAELIARRNALLAEAEEIQQWLDWDFGLP